MGLGYAKNRDRKPPNQNGQEVEAKNATGLPVKAHPENLLGHKARFVVNTATSNVGAGTGDLFFHLKVAVQHLVTKRFSES